MANLALADLVQALTEAVVGAQNGVQDQQLALLYRFFDAQGRPACMPIMVPKAGSSAAADDYNLLNVPLISLVEATMLHITEFEVTFDVELNGFDGVQATSADGLDHEPAGAAPTSTGAGGAGGPAVTAPARAPGAPLFASSPTATAPRRPFGFSLFGRGARPDGPNGPRVVYPAIGEAPRAAADLDVAPSAAAAPVVDPSPEVGPPAMIVGLGPKGVTTPTAKATLKVSSRSMSDGMVRLLNQLNKTF